VTGDEIGVAHSTPETKRQSSQRQHNSFPSAKKFKTSISDKKNHGFRVVGPKMDDFN